MYIHNKNKSLRFCKLSLKNRIPLSAVWFPFAQHKNEPKLCIGYLLQFFFCFLKLLFKWKHISRIGLFIRYIIYIIIYIYIYIYICRLALLCFSPLAEALQVCDVIWYDNVNPHVLLFAAFCACKMNPRKTNVSIFNGSQTLILSNLIQF